MNATQNAEEALDQTSPSLSHLESRAGTWLWGNVEAGPRDTPQEAPVSKEQCSPSPSSTVSRCSRRASSPLRTHRRTRSRTGRIRQTKALPDPAGRANRRTSTANRSDHIGELGRLWKGKGAGKATERESRERKGCSRLGGVRNVTAKDVVRSRPARRTHPLQNGHRKSPPRTSLESGATPKLEEPNVQPGPHQLHMPSAPKESTPLWPTFVAHPRRVVTYSRRCDSYQDARDEGTMEDHLQHRRQSATSLRHARRSDACRE